MAITDVFTILAAAIIFSGVAILVLADGVIKFLERNRIYEVFVLFILLVAGIVLLGECGQTAAHAMHDPSLALKFFGYEVVPMLKTTLYFSVVVVVGFEIIQSGHSCKLAMERKHKMIS